MAVTQNTYTGDGSTVLFSFTFPYLETTDIKVSVNGTTTTAYTLANATTVQFNTAPVNGAAIRIYRETDDSNLQATFYPGSAIRSSDLNDNFTQNLYVTQEANNVSAAATTTANTALTNSNTAISTANTALSTANTASTNASAAVTTANTASTNASAAVSTANTASTNASAAVTTANSAAADAATALSTANTALSTANTASTNASAAVSTANTASTNASAAVTTANTASSNATTAVSTANTAASNASTALSTANTAISTANAAASAVANAILYDTVANVAAIPGSPANNDAVEVVDSTGIESFTPLSGVPTGFVGDSGLSVRLVYTTTGSTWNWIQYFPNDPEARYGDAITTLQGDVLGLDNNKLALAGGTMTGTLTLAADPTTDLQAATKQYVDNNLPPGTTVSDTAPSSPGAGDLWYDSVGGRLYVWYDDGNTGQWVDASPQGNRIADFSAGSAGSPGLYVEGDTDTGIYSPGANQLAISTGGSERLRVDSSGRLGVGTASPDAPLEVASAAVNGAISDGVRVHMPGDFGGGSSGSSLLFTALNGSLAKATYSSIAGLINTNTAGSHSGVLTFSTASGGTNSERARIDSSGRLLVGTSSSRSSSYGFNLEIEATSVAAGIAVTRNSNDANGSLLALSKSRSTTVGGNTLVSSGDNLGKISFIGSDGTNPLLAASVEAQVDGTPGTNDMPGRLVFSTTADGASTPTERMRIGSDGQTLITAAPTTAVIPTLKLTNSKNVSGDLGFVNNLGSNCNNTSSYHAIFATGGADKYYIYGNGTTGTPSDINLKKNIETTRDGYLEDLCQLRVVKYNWNEQADGEPKELGVIAQELEQVFPGLIQQGPEREDGSSYKSVKTSVLPFMLLKALQEAAAKIETLEAQNADILTRLTALEGGTN